MIKNRRLSGEISGYKKKGEYCEKMQYSPFFGNFFNKNVLKKGTIDLLVKNNRGILGKGYKSLGRIKKVGKKSGLL